MRSRVNDFLCKNDGGGILGYVEEMMWTGLSRISVVQLDSSNIT